MKVNLSMLRVKWLSFLGSYAETNLLIKRLKFMDQNFYWNKVDVFLLEVPNEKHKKRDYFGL